MKMFCKKDEFKEEVRKISNDEISSIRRRCEITSSNYGNLAKRLQKRKTIFQILLPYYSVIGILNSLLSKYFVFDNDIQKSCILYWGIFISVSFLVISMQITLANYPERINEATKKLNDLKILKGKLVSLDFSNRSEFDDIVEKYDLIVSSGTLINERYFYATCKEMDRKAQMIEYKNFIDKFNNLNKIDIKELFKLYLDSRSNLFSETKAHFSTWKSLIINITNFFEFFSYMLIFALPVFIYILIIFVLK